MSSPTGATSTISTPQTSSDLPPANPLSSAPRADKSTQIRLHSVDAIDDRVVGQRGANGGRGVSEAQTEVNRAASEKPPKKKKRKAGWKGWALLVEDENGNVIEVRDRPESPEREEALTPLPSREGSTAAAPLPPIVVSELQHAEASRKSASPALPPVIHDVVSSSTSQAQAGPSGRATSGPIEDVGPSEGPASKKRRKNSPVASATPQPEPVNPQSGPASAATPSTPAEAKQPAKQSKSSRPSTGSAPTRTGTAGLREEARQAQASSRVGTPNSNPVPLIDEQPLPKVPRVGMGEIYAPPPDSDIRGEALFIIESANRRRESDKLRLGRDDDSGGEHSDLTPPPSDDDDDYKPNVPPRSSKNNKRTSNASNGHASSSSKRQNGSTAVPYPTPVTGTSVPNAPFAPLPYRQPGSARNHYNVSEAGPSSPRPATIRRRSTIVLDDADDSQEGSRMGPPESYPEGSFEAEFAAIEMRYRAGVYGNSDIAIAKSKAIEQAETGILPSEVALGRGINDPPPPKFFAGQRPTMVLMPSGGKLKLRDKIDREHAEGFEGLTPEIQSDCEGFLVNVKENLRNIILYFFPQPSPRREAFLERIGRGMVDMGWDLSDNGDFALNLVPLVDNRHPRRRESRGAPPGFTGGAGPRGLPGPHRHSDAGHPG